MASWSASVAAFKMHSKRVPGTLRQRVDDELMARQNGPPIRTLGALSTSAVRSSSQVKLHELVQQRVFTLTLCACCRPLLAKRGWKLLLLVPRTLLHR